MRPQKQLDQVRSLMRSFIHAVSWLGVGRALAEAIVKEARLLGYRTMRLDTSIRQDEPMGLHQRLGFKSIEPYYELPAELRSWLVFMELVL